jgi:hypothetical protein
MELSWKHNIMDFAMPYFIQVMREYTAKVRSQFERVSFHLLNLFSHRSTSWKSLKRRGKRRRRRRNTNQ